MLPVVGIETLYLTSGYSKGHQKETKRLGDQFLFGEPPFQFLAIKQVFPQMMLCLTSGLIFTSDQLWVTRILQCSSLGKARLAFWILFERTRNPMTKHVALFSCPGFRPTVGAASRSDPRVSVHKGGSRERRAPESNGESKGPIGMPWLLMVDLGQAIRFVRMRTWWRASATRHVD